MYRLIFSFFFALVLATGANAQDPYRIKSGDTLQIEVLEDASLNRSVLVLPDGSISFPLVGNVQAAGQSVGQVRSALSTGLSSNFATSPNIFVSVGALAAPRARSSGSASPRTRDIFVTGEISNPGKLDVSPGTTILQAIAQAGGLTRFAAGKRIQLHRGDAIYHYNFFSANDGIASSTVLAPGDVLVIPQRRLFE